MAELLFELLSEEIPARMQGRAAEDLKRLIMDGLRQQKLRFTKLEAFVTPRRLATVIDGLPQKQEDSSEEKKGPRVGSPQTAIDGFLKSAGLSSLEQAERRSTEKGDFWFSVVERPGKSTAEVLPEILSDVVESFPWPKSMKWADNSLKWVRPLHSVLALFDGKPLPVYVRLNGETIMGTTHVECGVATQGHRFMAPVRFSVTSGADYKIKLREHKVILDQNERRKTIESQAVALAVKEGLRLREDPGLLDEVTGLVEWPVPLMGAIYEEFMDLPQEVLITSMRAHQKYFACLNPDGSLAPRFVVIANTETQDGGKVVVAGNERVLRARLSDAKFFWDQDRKTKLAERVPALNDIVFHRVLGTIGEKVDRIQALAAELLPFVPHADADLVRSAATLCKADLVTGLVGEFAELQGIMGRYYALQDLEKREVADAIADHYRPLGPTDVVPTKPTSIVVALADKIDSLVGLWVCGEKPTGSGDPFALRRAALGVVRILLENGIRLPLSPIINKAYAQIEKHLIKRAADGGLAPFDIALALSRTHGKHFGISKDITMGELVKEMLHPKVWSRQQELIKSDISDFFADRLKVHLREQGVRHDLVSAVFALGNEDDLVRLMARVKALQEFLGTDNGKNLLVAYNRAANIVRAEEKKDKKSHNGAVDAGLFRQDEEKAVAAALDRAMPQVEKALAAENFVAAMAALAELRGPLDDFFDRVTVNAEDAALRVNRLNLLTRIRSAMDRVADFSKIEG